MPSVIGHYATPLEVIATAWASGVTLYVRDRSTRAKDPVCDVILTREDLARLLARVDELAARDPAPPLVAVVES